MKIGMITFHAVQNLGANLQAYALNKYINDNIAHCEIIDFVPNTQVSYSSSFRKAFRFVKAMVLYPFHIKENRFKKFQRENYVLSKRRYEGDADIEADPPKYDILVSGSDQVLNTTLSGTSKSYYLYFDDKAKKISYASSFGRSDISDDEYKLINRELGKFGALSVREQSAADIIKNEIGIDANLVLDPVFLLSADEWNKVASKIYTPSKYILVYAMEVTETIQRIVQQAKEKFFLPVLVVYGGASRGIVGEEIKDCGPSEFLSYIKNAELVITNSFHGTAFSIIYEKNFLCIAHSTRNTRLENVMQLCNNSAKLIDCKNTNKMDENIVCGKQAFLNIALHIDASKSYLKRHC